MTTQIKYGEIISRLIKAIHRPGEPTCLLTQIAENRADIEAEIGLTHFTENCAYEARRLEGMSHKKALPALSSLSSKRRLLREQLQVLDALERCLLELFE